MKTSLRQRIKRSLFKIRTRSRLAELRNEVSAALQTAGLTVTLDPREPYSPRALCFIVSVDGEPRYFGKQIAIDSEPDHYDYAGVHIYNGRGYIEKSLDMAALLTPDRLTPDITLVGRDIMLIDYIKHPTFLSLGANSVNLGALLRIALGGLRTLHKRGLAHLDPNWGNFFLVDPEGLPIIIDFDRKLSDRLADMSAVSIDFLSSYGGLFLTRQLQEACLANSGNLARVFWTALQDHEQQELSEIRPRHVRVLYPKLDRKPALRKGLADLETVSGLSLLGD